MGRGKWTRWGRGSCEGWSLDIGGLIASATRNPVAEDLLSLWVARVNVEPLGVFATREEAQARAEGELRLRIEAINADWAFYRRET